MKKLYFLAATLLMIGSGSAQLLQENFDTSIPGTWNVVDGGAATGDSWISGLQNGSNSLDGTACAFVDSDANGNGIQLIETLESPSFDGTGYLSVVLEFDQYYRHTGAGSSQVEVWDGAAWQSVLIQTASTGGFNSPNHQTIDISAYANPSMQVRFHYDDGNNWAWYWLVDNVVVNGLSCDLVSNGMASNISHNMADISWTSTGANFDIEYGAPGFTPGTGAALGAVYTANNPETITGLMPITSYEAYVRSNCSGPGLIISGLYDGPLTGGTPKGVELYAMTDIADLSMFGIGSANNGGGSDGEEFTFPSISVPAGTYIYVTSDSIEFVQFFGFSPDYESGSMLINGDDAVELFYNGNVTDVFGDINVDGTGQSWEYLDGWAYRNDGAQPNNGVFVDTDWMYSGINATDGCTDNGTCGSVMPVGTFTTNFFASVWEGPIAFVTLSQYDAYVNQFIAPMMGCGLTTTEDVVVEYANQGGDTIFSFDICYVMNGGTPVCESINDTILPNGTFVHTFATQVDLSIPGAYTFDSYITVTGDSDNSNDTLVGYAIQSIQTISSFPYSENFEAGMGAWAGNGDWQHGTPAGATINSVSACLGGSNVWMTNLTGPYSNSANFVLESYCFDLSGLTTDPILSFDLNYITESCCDEGWVEYSTDGGQTWLKLGASGSGINWYNDAGNQWWDGNSNGWVTAATELTGLAGQSSVRLRFVFSSDGSVTQDGFAIDNINIANTPFADAMVQSLDNPVSSCGLGAADSIKASFIANGLDTIIGFDVCYTINGGAQVCETVNDTLFPGQVYNHTFLTTGDFSIPGSYDVQLSIVTTDLDTCNNTQLYTVQNIQTISSLPYSEDFEAGMGDWSGDGDWQHGIPAGATINSSNCGTNVWMTNLTGPYSNNAGFILESPCIDFSGLTTDPILSFDLNYITESCCDEGWAEYSTDGGQTWTKLGASGSGINWYNDAGNQWWDGNSNGWVTAATELTGLAGQSSVRLRFIFSSDGSVTQDGFAIDNINIANTSFVDATALSLDSPESSCGLTAADSIRASFIANGLDTIIGFDVCYTINGGTQICETVNDTLFPGQAYSHTFLTTGDFSAIGSYDVELSIVTSDLNGCNNAVVFMVNNNPEISNYPYYETFENGSGGWSAENGANGTWELTTPTAAVINSAASGVNAWVTNATGSYNNNDNSSVLSPCFDMTNLPTGAWVVMKTWWNAEFSWDGANLQISVDSGNNWVNVGASGDPDNWFTDNSISGLGFSGNQDGWSGRNSTGNGSGTWVISKHALDDTLIGKPHVLFRVNFGSDGSVVDEGFAFDDFGIGVPPTVNAGPDYVGCGSYDVTLAGTGTFEWFGQDTLYNNPPVLFNTGNTGTFPNTGATDTTYYGIVVYTDSMGLSGSDTIRLELSPAPYNQLNDTVVCPGDAVTFYADQNPNHIYSWNNFITVDSSTYSFNSSTTGGMVIVTTTNFTNSCSHTDTAMVIQTPAVSISNMAFCQGDSAMLDAGSDYVMWNWSTGDTTQITYVSNSGQVNITATDNIGCVTMDSAMVTMNPTPTPTITGASDTLCSLASFNLDAGSFSSYTWSTGGSSQVETVDGPTLGLGMQTITVMVTDANGCTGMDTVMFEVVQCTSLDETLVDVSIYPNPSSGVFNLDLSELSGQIKLNLSDLTGKSIKQWNTNNAIEKIDLTNVDKGVYLLQIKTEAGQATVRLIKE